MGRDCCLELDIGTSSVGWDVTDCNYKVCKKWQSTLGY